MTAPHLLGLPGPAADFAVRLRGALPRLETGRLILRAPVIEDAEAWIAIMVPDTEGHLGGPHDAEAAFREFTGTVGLWLLRGHGVLTVTDKAGAVLGFVQIGFEPGDQEPELGWLFLPEAQGRGLATEAVRALRDHAGALGMRPLVSYIDPGNVRSAALARRLGASRDPAAEAAVDNACHAYRHPAPEARG